MRCSLLNQLLLLLLHQVRRNRSLLEDRAGCGECWRRWLGHGDRNGSVLLREGLLSLQASTHFGRLDLLRVELLSFLDQLLTR